MAAFTALASLARTVLEAARNEGLDEAELLREAGLPRAAVDDLDGRVEVGALFRLWELAAEASADPFFGLHVGERVVSSKTFHVVGYAARRCQTLGESFQRTARFSQLTNEGTERSLRMEGATAVMSIGPRTGAPPWPRCYIEMSLATHLSLGHKWTGVAFAPRAARFQYAAPRDLSEYRRLFGTDLVFGAAMNELVVDASVVALPMRDMDPELLSYLDVRAADLQARAQSERQLEKLACAQISKELTPGPPLLRNVAGRLGMSARTLQRRLSDEGLSFAAMVDDVRRAEALALVRRPLSVSEIAALVGYQDDESFRAAFVRWTGKTPRDYRKTAG